MFTQCPVCNTVFNVKPEHLNVAGGKVRCSRCQSIFNANEHRYSPESTASTQVEPSVTKPTQTAAAKPQVKQARPKPTAKSAPPPIEKPAPATKPPRKENPAPVEPTEDEWFDLTPSPANKSEAAPKVPSKTAPKEPSKTVPKAAAPTSDQPQSVEDELNEDLFKLFDTPETEQPSTPVPEAPQSVSKTSEKKSRVEAESKRTDNTTKKSAEAKKESSSKDNEAKPAPEIKQKTADKSSSNGYSLPPQLEARPVRATMKTLFYAVSNLLLVAALAVQYAYSHRIPLQENEALRPWLDTLCKVTTCPMPPKRDLSKIELVDNMMQSHPRYKNSLLITATLINRADYVQPYPIVEITMTNLQQKVVARRTFRPEEYLVGDTAEMGFTPNIEVALMLEVADPGNNAVGFKFDFY